MNIKKYLNETKVADSNLYLSGKKNPINQEELANILKKLLLNMINPNSSLRFGFDILFLYFKFLYKFNNKDSSKNDSYYADTIKQLGDELEKYQTIKI